MALTADRETKRRESTRNEDPVAAAVKIYGGSLVVLDAAGNAKPGVTAFGLTARGRAADLVDNSPGSAGDVTVQTARGVFRFANDGTHTVDRTHIGGTAYIVDDQTVASTDGTGTRSAAGIIRDLDAQGVWVEI